MPSPAPDAHASAPTPDKAPDTPDRSAHPNGLAEAKDAAAKSSSADAARETRTEPEQVPAQPAAEPSGSAADRPLVNGDAAPDRPVEAANAAPDASEPTAAEAESVDKSSTPSKPPHPPASTPVAGDALGATTAAGEKKRASPDPEPKLQPTPEPTPAPGPGASEDVNMADPASPTKEAATEPAPKPADDTEMTDAPVNVSPAAAQAADSAPAQSKAPRPASKVESSPVGLSQLAIGAADDEPSPADVAMADAPAAKVARERDEDGAEEPAPKRARTEPKDEGPGDGAAEATGDAIAAGGDMPGLDMTALTQLVKWVDAEFNAAAMSPFQRREIRKVISRIKKTKSGSHFRDSVQKLWPALWDGYIARIERPMDLAELDRAVRDPNSLIVTFGDFQATLSLIFENAMSFNGPAHDITAAAAHAVRAVWEEAVALPAEEPARPKAAPKAKPVRESRVVANVEAPPPRRQSAAPPPAGSPPASAASAVEASAASAATATAAPAAPAAAHDAPADRRSSTATDGDRPKRTVRAPKPKDIDYTTKPSRKKLKPELQFADEVLAELVNPKHFKINQWFLEPVDAEGLNIPSYYSIIKKPMDLGKVHRMLGSGDISSLKDFDKNVRLVFENCYRFNGPPDQGNPVAILAKQLEDLYVSQMKNKDAWLAKHAKSTAPAASASNASDDDDDDDDDDEGGDAAQAVADNRAVEALQAKLDEETKKLNGMLLSGNLSMIDIQKNIVDMVQQHLIKAAQNAQQARPRSDKAKKSKPAKSKAAGGPGRKAAGGGDKPKKAGNSKKAAPKKMLSNEEKDQVAQAINDLDSPHLDLAIDIIKQDTGQNENNEGELELEIDQLSNAALLKLWDLCKKALPGFGKDSGTSATAAQEAQRPAKQAKTAAKPKKNKPMTAKEQEARIAELNALRKLYKSGQEPADTQKVMQAPTPKEPADSSDDSDSEEE